MVIGIWNKGAEGSGGRYFSNFDSLKSTETHAASSPARGVRDFSNFDSLKSTETAPWVAVAPVGWEFQQFRLVEEY